ncbi:MAG: hypothetical protein QM713_10650 [Arachnia sp.]
MTKPLPAPAPDTTPEPVLAIGPANYAGQAHMWARATQRALLVPSWSFTRGPVRRGGFSFPADVTIPAPLFHTGLLRGIGNRLLFDGTTHLAIDGYQPWFRLKRDGVLGADVRALMRRGLNVALIAHGTDVRDPALHRERLRWSFFNEGTEEWRQKLTAFSAMNRGFARELGLPLFVSTPDLLLDLPEATWIPVCVDIDAWAAPPVTLQRPVPRVLHIPSKRNPPIKGTQYIEPVMRKLEAEGLIEYVAPEGAVPHRTMPHFVRSVDIVVDQILSGCYGVAAVEAMAAGRVVVSSLAPDVAALMPEAPKLIDATPDTLEAVMRGILEDRDQARASAKATLAFAQYWHAGTGSAVALSRFLGIRK